MRARDAFLTPLLVAGAVLAAACARVPVDPDGTTRRVRGGVLRAGAVHAPPWIVLREIPDGDREAEVGGLEAELVETMARALGARVEWRPGGPTERLEELERRELDLVVGGFTDRDPWTKRLAVTRPHHESGPRFGKQRRVLFLSPGENRWLLTVDRFLHDEAGAASGTESHARR